MNALNNIIKNYCKFVFAIDEKDNIDLYEYLNYNNIDLYEYLDYEFKETAFNNFVDGFDIVKWYQGKGYYIDDEFYETDCQGSVNELFNTSTLCESICFIQNYYSDNYGDECLMCCKDITPEKVLQHYAYAYASQIPLDELIIIVSKK